MGSLKQRLESFRQGTYRIKVSSTKDSLITPDRNEYFEGA